MARRQKYAQGRYTVRNPRKYVGKGKPTYRSGWELTFMIFCDSKVMICDFRVYTSFAMKEGRDFVR